METIGDNGQQQPCQAGRISALGRIGQNGQRHHGVDLPNSDVTTRLETCRQPFGQIKRANGAEPEMRLAFFVRAALVALSRDRHNNRHHFCC
jgi:hypothetical protein